MGSRETTALPRVIEKATMPGLDSDLTTPNAGDIADIPNDACDILNGGLHLIAETQL